MIDQYDVYIGRPGPFGNPYSHKEGTMAKYKVSTKKEAVEKYKQYILNNKDLLEKTKELEGKTLGCWCAKKEGLTTDDPFICHGQIILKIIEDNCEKKLV